MIKKLVSLTLTCMLVFQMQVGNACTNFLITRGASIDGSTMVTYAADSHSLYGELYFQPAADHVEGTMRKVYEWDTGKFLGEIPQIAHTYQVIGNMNEHQLVIGETTFGGRKELSKQTGAIIDYGSLIYITLQRAKTAREAIHTMAQLVEDYGYYSSGESFSIADGKEVWIMELIGKGEGEKGAVWVAQRVPDGYISGHANQARITTFPLKDSENCLYSKDVITFAQRKGWFDGKNKEFSFSDTYAPVDFGAARFCDARVWAGFNKVNSDMGQYENYALGKVVMNDKGVATNRPPLWIKPDAKLSAQDVMGMMRDHYEGTALDMTKDVGAGPHALPYRWRGLTWEVDSVTYCNERAISTQQTGFSFVGQSRGDLPAQIGGILWFGVDDTYTTCYSPVYCGTQQIPETFQVGNGDFFNWGNNAAFWVFNQVTNFCYLRYNDMVKDVQNVQNELETKYVSLTPAIDQAALTLWNNGQKELALQFITDYSVNTANNMTTRWKELAQYLMIKYKDGNIMKEENGQFKYNPYGVPASPNMPGYNERWKRNVVNETGDHLRVK